MPDHSSRAIAEDADDDTDIRELRVGTIVQSREVVLDLERRETLVRGSAVALTKQEFDLLSVLAARPGILFSRTALLKAWSGDTYVTERTVDTVVTCLRRKIERDPQDPEVILTAPGGYTFADNGTV
jgi:DNA-binding response OmpR family regulator